jgi:hypothetical protein
VLPARAVVLHRQQVVGSSPLDEVAAVLPAYVDCRPGKYLRLDDLLAFLKPGALYL